MKERGKQITDVFRQTAGGLADERFDMFDAPPDGVLDKSTVPAVIDPDKNYKAVGARIGIGAIRPTGRKGVPDHLRKLNKKEALFVDAVSAGLGLKAACEAAGYSTTHSGREALRRTHVQLEVMRRLGDGLVLGSVEALETIRELVRNGRSEYVRLEAAKDVLNRSGVASRPSQDSLQGSSQLIVNIDLSGTDTISMKSS